MKGKEVSQLVPQGAEGWLVVQRLLMGKETSQLVLQGARAG